MRDVLEVHETPRVSCFAWLYLYMGTGCDLFIHGLSSGGSAQEFYERHRSVAVAMILVVFLFPFAGLYVTGLFGAVLASCFRSAAYYLTPYVWLKLVPEDFEQLSCSEHYRGLLDPRASYSIDVNRQTK